MGGISINLLPQDIILQRKQSSKLVLVNRISVGVLVTLVFFTSATGALRIMQNSELKEAENGLAYATERVTGLKSTEDKTFILKERLGLITTLVDGDQKRKEIFNLVVFLTPPDMQISEALVDKNGQLTASFSSPSLSAVQTLISNLSDKEKNSGLVAKVNLEGLSLGKDSTYRFNLKISPK
ncbi:hypothetical protein A3E45_01650 [Candidatus Daviesbacteria bacterium RIFCSPHIGHO2_12_FULL_43_11]|uniref:PilN domain-containing protein n=1 Tax=Candidatus Daviesbacteria bacterium RIFCSPHIGHO2_12_FULL_43_11 TaxID=1797780 RepID=A0A1F5K2S1_9BACT|nr:MAG: hypothetical protein A2874_00070 [Candidatus Daviesbacteria bacterium RIFCSPHIGHO2_01_FULL_43_17]OGE35011.1 MAG: hypothetical protein A3E45_01650 [Candidatus Daviesbacteria bacterium RIFCSPHIGHO2_12_FULL_43_11]OGE69037.1 MAG: hypothetical protein A3J21_00805 [Candidatus Daviesbacteria bacterium RIFCSPLOWO2_02_FULL_43_11]